MDLCTLAQVKAYLGITGTASDSILSSLISAYSKRVERYCSRTFSSTDYAEFRNGNGQRRLMLRQWPVTAIASVAASGRAIGSAGTNVQQAGYRKVDAVEEGDGRLLVLTGYCFDVGYSNVQINYTAGYAPVAVLGEQWNIPSVTPFTITVLEALKFISVTEVRYVIGGAVLTQVAGNPAAGQYSASEAGLLTFNAADAGVGVLIDYLTIGFPEDLSEALIELVALRYKSRDWTGYRSKTLATETITFMVSDMSPSIKGTLDAYSATVVPV